MLHGGDEEILRPGQRRARFLRRVFDLRTRGGRRRRRAPSASDRAARAGDAGRAALHAQSLLDEFGNLPQPQQRDGELDEGRYRWRLDVERWQDPSAQKTTSPVDANGAQLMHLRLQVEWGAGEPAQRVEMSSLRLVVPQAAGIAAP